jgi:diguanylate cyclase (GGDEF)-like protein
VLMAMAGRAGDVVARYGGEEFAVLLPNTTLHNAEQLAESIRRAIARTVLFNADGLGVTGTVCVGIASHIPGTTDNAFRLLQVADKALYRAKVNGRNCVQA